MPKETFFVESSRWKLTKRGKKNFIEKKNRIKILENSNPTVKKYLKPLFSKKQFQTFADAHRVQRAALKWNEKKQVHSEKAATAKKQQW